MKRLQPAQAAQLPRTGADPAQLNKLKSAQAKQVITAARSSPAYRSSQHGCDTSVLLTQQDMQNLSDPLTANISTLVGEQLARVQQATGRRCRKVLLVGGFCSSAALAHTLMRELGSGAWRWWCRRTRRPRCSEVGGDPGACTNLPADWSIYGP